MPSSGSPPWILRKFCKDTFFQKKKRHNIFFFFSHRGYYWRQNENSEKYACVAGRIFQCTVICYPLLFVLIYDMPKEQHHTGALFS